MVPYFWGVWSGNHHPTVTSWILWSLIGLVFLVSYKDAGAEDNVSAGVVAFTNPFIITVVAIYKGNPWNNLGVLEWIATAICTIALLIWWHGHKKMEKRWIYIALAASIIADICAGGLTTKLAWTDPMQEQPISWGIYLIGQILFFFSVNKDELKGKAARISQYAPLMYAAALAIAILIPTVAHRIAAGTPFLQWF
jgi:hypothetical protein